MEKILEVAKEAAYKAGAILKERSGQPQKITHKGEINLVTETDKFCEKTILDTVFSYYPDHAVLCEESGILGNENSPFKWVIDPLDGTTNFAHGFPFFAVSIGIEKEGQLIAGVVYNPMLDEMITAIKGKGAYMNGKSIHVSDTGTLRKSLLATGFPYDVRTSEENNIKYFNEFLMHAQAVRRPGSAALDLTNIAMGRLDGLWELKLSPWDVAAGTLIIQEAGGKVTDFEGNESSIYKRYIVASNGVIHDQILDVIRHVNASV